MSRLLIHTLLTLCFCLSLKAQEVRLYKGYKLVWSDEFSKDGPPDPKKWSFEKGFIRNNELQWYSQENAYCKDGKLYIEARKVDQDNPNYKAASLDWKTNRKKIHYSSASLTTKGLHSWKYGRFEVRAKISDQTGLWSTIWTHGIEGEWPSSGEIDLLEYYDNSILANACWGTNQRYKAKWQSRKQKITSFNDPDWDKHFHTWRMDWNSKEIKLYLDDKLLNTIDLNKTINPTDKGPRNPFHQPHYLLLSLAVGGSAGGDPKAVEFPAKTIIDYVRIYQKK